MNYQIKKMAKSIDRKEEMIEEKHKLLYLLSNMINFGEV